MGFTGQKTSPAKHRSSKGSEIEAGFLPSENLGSAGTKKGRRGAWIGGQPAARGAGRREGAAPPADRPRDGGAGLAPRGQDRRAPAALPRARSVMEAPRARHGFRPRPGRLPRPHCPSGWGPGAGPPAGRGARGLRRGRALTRGLRARARHGPGGEGAGALLRAQEGGGGEGHSEEPAARAPRHRQRGQHLQLPGSGARGWTRRRPSSHTCRAATRRR